MSYGTGNFGGFENQAFGSASGSKESFKKLCAEIAAGTASLNKQSKVLKLLIDDDAASGEIESKKQECHDICMTTSQKLKDVKQLQNASTVSEQQERRATLTRLATGYQNAFKQYQSYANAIPSRENSEFNGANGGFATGDEQIQTQMSSDQLAAMEARNAEMAQLESDIVNVNEIFRDLNTQVATQGEMIDSIANHVEEAVVEVKSGNEQLVKAEEHQRAANKKKICLGATVAIIVIVIVIIIIVKST